MLSWLMNIEPVERAAARVLAIYYFLMTASYVMISNASSSLFLDRVVNSDDYYPLLMTFNAVVTTTLVVTFSRLAKRLPLIALAVGTNLFFALSFIVLEVALRLFGGQPQVPGITTGAMNVLSLGQYTVASFQYYLIASTMFDARQQKRILGIIGVGGALATIMGGIFVSRFTVIVESLVPGFGTEAVVLLVAALLIIMVFVIQRARPHMTYNTQGSEGDDSESQKQPSPLKLLREPYILTLMLIIGSFIVVATTIDYIFQVQGNAYFQDEALFTAFKGNYTAVTGTVQILIRLFVISPLLVNFGLIAGLLVLPLTIIGTTAAFVFNSNVWTATFMKGGDQATRFTVNETATELAWVPIPAEDRVVVKPFVSGTFIALMQGFVGISIFTFRQFDDNLVDPLRILAFIVLGITAVWIPAAIALQRGYLRKLMDSIRNRDIDFEDLNVDAADSAIVQTVEAGLLNGTDAERAFILDIIEDVPITPWVPVLTKVYYDTESIPVKEHILILSANYPQILPDDELLRLIETTSEVTDEAMIAAGERGMVGIEPLILQRLDDPNYEIRAAAARALIHLDSGYLDRAVETLRYLLALDDNEAANRYAMEAINRIDAKFAIQVAPPSLLRDLLYRSNTLRFHVMIAIANTKAPLLPDLVAVLEQRTTEPYVRKALQQYPAEKVEAELIRQYGDESAPIARRAAISRTFNDYLSEDILDVMVKSLQQPHRAIYNEAVDTILVYAREKTLPESVLARVEGEGLKLARNMYSINIALGRLDREAEPLLAEAFELDLREMVPTLLKLSVMDVPNTDIESVIYQLQRHDNVNLGNVLEILENVLSGVERAAIIPLFEDHTVEEFVEMGRVNFPDMDESLNDELLFYINYGDDWQCAIALDYVMRHPEAGIQLEKNISSISQESRQLVARYANASETETFSIRSDRQEANMLSILEKTVLLKNSFVFEDINARDLYHIAQITEDVHVPANEMLFEMGDPGNVMYIIVKGQVRIFSGETEIAVVSDGAPIGEIALLDEKPRSASAMTLTDTDMLAIKSDAFFSTVTAHVDINRAIMKMLAARVRDLIEHQ